MCMMLNIKPDFRGYGPLRTIILPVLCIFLTVNAYSQSMPDFAAPSSLTFDFVQRKSSAMLSGDIVNSGKMAFVAPDRIRWEYVAPYSSLFVMNGDCVLMENADGRKVTDAKSAGAYSRISRLVLPLVQGKFQEGESGDFKTTVTECGNCPDGVSGGDGVKGVSGGNGVKGVSGGNGVNSVSGGDFVRIEIVPLKSSGRRLFRRVVADIDRKLGVAVRIAIDESNGDKTVITCRNIVLNAPVDDGLFELHQ